MENMNGCIKRTEMNKKNLIYFLGLLLIISSCSKRANNQDYEIYNIILKSQTESAIMWRERNNVDARFFIPPTENENEADTIAVDEEALKLADSINKAQNTAKLIILINDSTCLISESARKTIESKNLTNNKRNELINNLLTGNNQSHFEKSILDPVEGYILANTGDIREYNKNAIIITKELRFSNVSYSKNNLLACVYLSTVCGNSCGGGSIFFLEYKRNRWEIIEELDIWVA